MAASEEEIVAAALWADVQSKSEKLRGFKGGRCAASSTVIFVINGSNFVKQEEFSVQ